MYTVVTFIVIVKISWLADSDQSPVIFISSHDLVFYNLFLILRTVLLTLFMLRLCYIMYYKDFGQYLKARETFSTCTVLYK